MKIKMQAIELLGDFFEHVKSRGFTFPQFTDSEEIVIFSDYSGDRPEDRHHSYSFYIVDRKILHDISFDIIHLRNSEIALNHKSFIEFKKLSQDSLRQRILPKFLEIFDNYEGLVITILIDENSPDYFLKVNNKIAKQMEGLGFGTWKDHILRKACNILSIMAFLAKTFLDKNKTLTWYSDRDDIFGGNQSQRKETLDMFCQFLKMFEVKMKGNSVRFISDKGTPLNSDFLAIPDLSAGGVLDYYQILYHGQSGVMKDYKKEIMGWMNLNSTKLKKLMVIGQEADNKKQLILLNNYTVKTNQTDIYGMNIKDS